MGARGFAALVVLLFASALLISPTTGRVLEGENPSSGKNAPAPTTVAASGSTKNTVAPKESEHPSKEQAAPAPSSKDKSKQGQAGGEAQGSALPPPPPPLKPKTNESPPPGAQGPNGPGKDEGTDKMKEVMAKCDASHKCSSGKEQEFSACLQVSDTASVGSFIIVHNQGQKEITVNVKEPSTYSGTKPLHLPKGAFGQINITYSSPDGGDITLHGNGDCIIHVQQSVQRQSVSDWQQQFQQIVATASRLNPIYGASFFVFTIVLVGGICACCKFTRKRGSEGVPYQQLEMGAQAPNSSAVDNATSTTDGWEDGWDDDWDDEEAPARPSDKKPTSSVSTNGLSLRSQTNSKDGWDVDWDD